MIPVTTEQFKAIVSDPANTRIFLNGQPWAKTGLLLAGAELRERRFVRSEKGELLLEDPTKRELEAHYRNEGSSRSQAEKLATEHLQKKEDGEDDMTPEQLKSLSSINARLDEVSEIKGQLEAAMAKVSRLSLGGGGGSFSASFSAPKNAEYSKAFNAFMRHGDESALRSIRAAVETIDDTKGGYGVPQELDRAVGAFMQNLNPMRQLCKVIPAGPAGYTKLFSQGGTASGWVGEKDARPETAASTLAALTPYWGEIYANPAATQTSLEDIFFDVEAWVTEEIAKEFNLQEGSSFVTGNGTLKPKGFLAYTITNEVDSARAFGSLQYLPTGAAADFDTASATVSPADVLFDTIYALKAGHRAGAAWQTNSLTLARVRKFKDTEGRPVWTDSIAAGQPPLLCGYPVYTNEDMDSIGSNKYPLAFGNWKAGYTIVDRVGITLLRNPYTQPPYVFFYSRKRVGGYVEDSQAIKLVKCSAS
jgi:HK97 family phage major capsid protein